MPVVWHIVWDATFTFVALIIISLLLDEAGFFQWAALHIARWGDGLGRRLFPLIVLLGGVIAAFFANDGAALLLTPIVVAILLRLDFTPAQTLAFVVATGFVADTTSLPLIISNLVNIVSANYFRITFNRYALVMVPVDLVALVATLAVLWAYFGRTGSAALPAQTSLKRRRTPFTITSFSARPFRCWRSCSSPILSWRHWACRSRSSPAVVRSCYWRWPGVGIAAGAARSSPSEKCSTVRPGRS